MVMSIFFCLLFFSTVRSVCSEQPTEQLKIGILRHLTVEQAEASGVDSTAERILLRQATARGHLVEIVNPLQLTYTTDMQPAYDVIISRAEIDTFTDTITDAYLRALDYFESSGIPVINSAQATLNAQDKLRTLLCAQKAGIAVPFTALVHSRQAIEQLIQEKNIRFPFFLKKPYGGCGRGVFLIPDHQTLNQTLARHFQPDEPILVEERINLQTDTHGNVTDMRIWVVRNATTGHAQCIGGALRIAAPGNCITNFSRGGTIAPLAWEHDPALIEFAQRALESIDADVAGIDIARDTDGNLYLLEINISFYTNSAFITLLGAEIWNSVLDLAQQRVTQNRARRKCPSICHPEGLSP